MVAEVWQAIPHYYSGVQIDRFVVMPNHFHGILVLRRERYPIEKQYSLPQVIQWFKSLTTKRYINGVHNFGWHPFKERLWQRNYYEHIIRNRFSLELIRHYIETNPEQWDSDPENPTIPLNFDDTRIDL